MGNKYGSLVEGWKVELVGARARRKGFRGDKIDDAEQDIIPALVSFVYDESKANGAAEATALTAVIDKRLTCLQRGKARRRRREEKYRELHGFVDGTTAQEPLEPDHGPRLALAMDVNQAMATLTPLEQGVCAALSRDDSLLQIAREMGLTRYAVESIVAGIRERFGAMGLDLWMGEI